NASGRAYPDISAQGSYFATVWNGTETLVSGTSASTPLFAAIIALVNDALIAGGKPTLGFLNPWLYKKAYRAFTDITSGSAVGCSEIGDGKGFPAVKGWDPVSGFGTPKFRDIIHLLGVHGNWNHTGGFS
ncbi:subtilisin-like protein, partial [Aureobasidium melanogenum]